MQARGIGSRACAGKLGIGGQLRLIALCQCLSAFCVLPHSVADEDGRREPGVPARSLSTGARAEGPRRRRPLTFVVFVPPICSILAHNALTLPASEGSYQTLLSLRPQDQVCVACRPERGPGPTAGMDRLRSGTRCEASRALWPYNHARLAPYSRRRPRHLTTGTTPVFRDRGRSVHVPHTGEERTVSASSPPHLARILKHAVIGSPLCGITHEAFRMTNRSSLTSRRRSTWYRT
jgi:hypothetical protein